MLIALLSFMAHIGNVTFGVHPWDKQSALSVPDPALLPRGVRAINILAIYGALEAHISRK